MGTTMGGRRHRPVSVTERAVCVRYQNIVNRHKHTVRV